MSSSWLRRLGIGELCSVWRERGEKWRTGLDVCVCEGGERKSLGSYGKIESREEKDDEL